MQYRFGVATGLLDAGENQITGSLKGDTVIDIRGHIAILGIAGVLAIHDGCHTLHCRADLRFAADTVVQPIGYVLTGYAQSRPVFHQAHIVNIRHFRAAHTLIHPANHVAQNALHIVIKLRLHVFRG